MQYDVNDMTFTKESPVDFGFDTADNFYCETDSFFTDALQMQGSVDWGKNDGQKTTPEVHVKKGRKTDERGIGRGVHHVFSFYAG